MRPLLASACSLFVATGLLAQSAPQVDVQSMLQGLDQLKQKQQQTAQASLNATLTAFANGASSDEAAQDFYLQAAAATQIPVRRVGQPADVAHVISFLVSEEAGFVSGQVIYVAGGPLC